ncbi:MAG: hypothetical protein R6U98_29490 [Pirellulaceae bacterium]
MESCPPQAVLPVVGLAADQVIRNRYNFDGVSKIRHPFRHPRHFGSEPPRFVTGCKSHGVFQPAADRDRARPNPYRMVPSFQTAEVLQTLIVAHGTPREKRMGTVCEDAITKRFGNVLAN